MEGLLEIPFVLDFETLRQQVRIKPGSAHEAELKQLAEQAAAIARPRAAYCIASVDACGENYVIVNQVRLTSRVLRVNLDQATQVFPYLATCGVELDAWSDSQTDLMHRFWAESINEMALFTAYHALTDHLNQACRPGKTSAMSPGSLADWPLTQQAPLFQILEDLPERSGVRLTDSMLMIPTKTVSGIRFVLGWDFESCQLCPRPGCPVRRAAYDETLFLKYDLEPVPASRFSQGGIA